MNIKLASPIEILDVYNIYMHKDVIPFLGYDPMSLEEFKDVYSELLNSKSFYTVYIEEKLAGFIKAFNYTGRVKHVAYLGTFAIAPEYHGKGIAKKVLEYFLDKFSQQGVIRFELFVERDNLKAISFL